MADTHAAACPHWFRHEASRMIFFWDIIPTTVYISVFGKQVTAYFGIKGILGYEIGGICFSKEFQLRVNSLREGTTV